MELLEYTRCAACDTEGLYKDGETCARCLGLGYVAVEDDAGEEEDLSSVPLVALSRAA